MGVRCVFCGASVIGSGAAVTIEGGAPAHAHCYQYELMSQRIFKHLKLTDLSDGELTELQDLVKLEVNSRSDAADEVELF